MRLLEKLAKFLPTKLHFYHDNGTKIPIPYLGDTKTNIVSVCIIYISVLWSFSSDFFINSVFLYWSCSLYFAALFILQLPYSHNSFLCYFELMLISDLFFNVRGCRAKESLCMSSLVMFNLIHGVIEKSTPNEWLWLDGFMTSHHHIAKFNDIIVYITWLTFWHHGL